jgi:hypothetical protein
MEQGQITTASGALEPLAMGAKKSSMAWYLSRLELEK